MLDELKKLQKSITNSQTRSFMEKLGDEDWGRFKSMLFSTTEDEAIERKGVFREAMRKREIPFLLSLHKMLDEEQQDLLRKIL